MEINKFIETFADAIEYEGSEQLVPETLFHELDEWDSVAGLSIIAMFDEEFDKEIKGDDIKTCNTLLDLYNLSLK